MDLKLPARAERPGRQQPSCWGTPCRRQRTVATRTFRESMRRGTDVPENPRPVWDWHVSIGVVKLGSVYASPRQDGRFGLRPGRDLGVVG